MDRKHNFEFVSRVLSIIVLHAPKMTLKFFVKVFNLWQYRIRTGKTLIAACNLKIYIQQVPVIHFAF